MRIIFQISIIIYPCEVTHAHYVTEILNAAYPPSACN